MKNHKEDCTCLKCLRVAVDSISIKDNGYIPPRFTEKEIISIIEKNLPEFAKACNNKKVENLIMTQSAFAVDYLMGEFLILAFAVKYAGIKGKVLTIIK